MLEQLEPHRFTLEHYHAMIEAGILGEDDRVELIHGAIVDMSPIGDPHIVTVNRLTRLFTVALGERAIVSIQNPVTLPPNSEPQPDVVIFEPRDDFYAKQRATPANVLLAVEVADSSLRYDRLIKMPLYASSGIREAWIVDVGAQCVEVYTLPKREHYGQMNTYRRGESIVTQAFADLSFEVDRMLP
jgi:Uma2 family endonuclease